MIEPQIYTFGKVERLLDNSLNRQKSIADYKDMISSKILEDLVKYKCKIFSLDVFDTFMLRNDKPEGMRYYELATEQFHKYKHILSTKNQKDDAEVILDILLARYMAMSISYQSRTSVEGVREGCLQDVIQLQLALLGLPESLADEFRKDEEAYESNNLMPNTALIEVCKTFVKDGGKVILLSDMYLEATSISVILTKVIGDLAYISNLYSSGDVILSKHSGKIFNYLVKEHGYESYNYFHIGDNWLSDYIKPKEAYWNAMLFPVSKYESHKRQVNLDQFKNMLTNQGLDLSTWIKV